MLDDRIETWRSGTECALNGRASQSSPKFEEWVQSFLKFEDWAAYLDLPGVGRIRGDLGDPAGIGEGDEPHKRRLRQALAGRLGGIEDRKATRQG